LVRFLKLSTLVPSKAVTGENRESLAARHNLKNAKVNYMCASACFLVFVAGIHRGHDILGPAILGMHRPSLSGNDLKRLSEDQVSAADDRVRRAVENYLGEMGIPANYAVDMFSVPNKRIRWIRNDDFERDIDGFIPELKPSVQARCSRRADAEKSTVGKRDPSDETEAIDKMGEGEIDERHVCERKVEAELALRARSEAVTTLRQIFPSAPAK
jgi:hypothetical protein